MISRAADGPDLPTTGTTPHWQRSAGGAGGWLVALALVGGVTAYCALVTEPGPRDSPPGQSARLEHGAVVCSVAISPDGRSLATGTADGTVCLAELGTGRSRVIRRGLSLPAWPLAFSHDGRYLAVAGSGSAVQVIDAESGEPRGEVAVEARPRAVAFEPGGPALRVAAWRGDGHAVLRRWPCRSRRTVPSTGPALDLAFAHGGALMATGGKDGMLALWEVGPARERFRTRAHDGAIVAVAVAPGGDLVATASPLDRDVRLWDASGGVRAVLSGHTRGVTALAFAAGGLLVSGSLDGTARLWDAGVARELAVFEGHRGAVLAVALSPDGRMLATGGHDETARVWDVARVVSEGRTTPSPGRDSP
jgi:WD40 repeat protein